MGLLVQRSYLRDTLGTWGREEPSVAKETLGSLRSQFITIISLIIIIIVLAFFLPLVASGHGSVIWPATRQLATGGSRRQKLSLKIILMRPLEQYGSQNPRKTRTHGPCPQTVSQREKP